jgi:predicted branched-subunit amino acid permease
MTAMFVVIFMEQWMKEKHHISAYIGLGAAVVCLILFGADSFMIPTMLVIVTLLAALRKPLERNGKPLERNGNALEGNDKPLEKMEELEK